MNEADTSRLLVTPKLVHAGWDAPPHSLNEQMSFTDGRILATAAKPTRLKGRRADYILRYRRDYAIAVVEAKADTEPAASGLQQAKEYAEILGLKFAYSTNGNGIVEFDYTTGEERELDAFPTPDELWQRLAAANKLETNAHKCLLAPYHRVPGKTPRYYQETAINRAVQSIVSGRRRILLTMATGTGKTFVAFQICWKLWSTLWNRLGEHRRPKILYLADRNVLVDDPKDKMFASFGDARHKIQGEAVVSRDIYFALYQAIARDERRPGLYREYPPDFFDLIIVDECHRGSARDESNWREILEYFEPAVQLGMTATPLREDNRDTYEYFGNPVYTYSLRQGIDDGFLAPYRVHRIVTNIDAAGWRPSQDDIDRYGRQIPDAVYGTPEFERQVAMLKRTEAIARNLASFMRANGRMAKTMVFCVDQEHALEMRKALVNLNSDLVSQYPDYVCRVTADEADIGLAQLSKFQDVETESPVILTTSQLLSTGVDAPTCRNVVLARVIGSMTEFKQIIGRGTRVYADGGKYFFNILDYTGTATTMFADPDFDGDPALISDDEMDENGDPVPAAHREYAETEDAEDTPIVSETPDGGLPPADGPAGLPRKYYFDGGHVEVVAHMVYEIDPNGRQLRVVEYSTFAREKVRSLFANVEALKKAMGRPKSARAGDRGTGKARHQPGGTGAAAERGRHRRVRPAMQRRLRNADARRRQRADRIRQRHPEFCGQYAPAARRVLELLLEKYAEHGLAQFRLPDALKLPELQSAGNIPEIVAEFGGPEQLRAAIGRLQACLYDTVPT